MQTREGKDRELSRAVTEIRLKSPHSVEGKSLKINAFDLLGANSVRLSSDFRSCTFSGRRTQLGD